MMSEYNELLHSVGHWMFEMTTDLVFTGVLFLLGRIPFKRWVKRHDQEHHEGHTTQPEE